MDSLQRKPNHRRLPSALSKSLPPTLVDLDVKATYLHSEIDTLELLKIIHELRFEDAAHARDMMRLYQDMEISLVNRVFTQTSLQFQKKN